MKILYNENLKEYTTIHIGGIANVMMVPESLTELMELVKALSPHFFLGGGSNLLINEREFDLVINLRQFNMEIENLKNGRFKAGASVRLQEFIDIVNENGYGGIEYLYSVPGLVGGAIAMNAGRGREYKKNISDYIVSVDAIIEDKLVTVDKEKCGFEYRESFFKNSPIIIVSAVFEFPKMNIEDSLKAKKERLLLSKAGQDHSAPNFGSVFMKCDAEIMAYAKTHKIGSKKVHFSEKSMNWLINENNGCFEDAIHAIEEVEDIHKNQGKECKREVVVWD